MNARPTPAATLAKLVAPVALLLLISVTVIGGLVAVAARGQDRVATAASVHLMRAVLGDTEHRLAQTALDYTWWTEAVDNLVTKPDPTWADANIGTYLYETFAITSSHVLDANDGTVYGMIDGKRRQGDPLKRFSGGLGLLLERTRAGSQTDQPRPASGLLRDGEAIHVAAASVLTTYPSGAGNGKSRATGSVLIVTRKLDADLLAGIAGTYLLDGLRLQSPGTEASAASLDLSLVDSTPAATLAWRVELPGRGMLRWVLPSIGGVFLVVAGLSAVFFLRTQRAVQLIDRQGAAILHEQERAASYLAIAGAIIVALDRAGNVTLINRKGCELLGRAEADLVGRNWIETAAPEGDGKTVVAALERTANGNPGSHESVEHGVVGRDGGRRSISWNYIAVRDDEGGIIGTLGSGEDITARKAAADKLRAAKEAADAANRAKSSFLSAMSHELRTPLNAILGFGQMLELRAAEPLTETQREYVEYILASGQHLLALIEEVLDLAKIEAGTAEVNLEELSPEDMVAECLVLSGNMAEGRGIEIDDRVSGRGLPLVRVDGMRFNQVLLNLLSNAIKYNRDGGTVVLDCQEGAAGMLRLGVSDTGPGIPDDRQGELFEPFNRLGAEASMVAGTGIGLSVARELIERMGGRIGFESTVGEGSTFWIEVPRARGQDAGEPP